MKFEDIHIIHQRTGLSFSECKRILTHTDGSVSRALEIIPSETKEAWRARRAKALEELQEGAYLVMVQEIISPT